LKSLSIENLTKVYANGLEALKGISGETDLARAQAELAEAEARYRAAQKLKGKR